MLTREEYAICNDFARNLQKVFNYKFISSWPTELKDTIVVHISHTINEGWKQEIMSNLLEHYARLCKIKCKYVVKHNVYRLNLSYDNMDTFIGFIRMHEANERCM